MIKIGGEGGPGHPSKGCLGAACIILAIILGIICTPLYILSAKAETPATTTAPVKLQETEKTWFVQVWTTVPAGGIELEEGEAPGRVEVSAEGKFVACAQAFVSKGWNKEELIPISIGFIFKGDKDKLKFEGFEGIKRKTKIETRITEVPIS